MLVFCHGDGLAMDVLARVTGLPGAVRDFVSAATSGALSALGRAALSAFDAAEADRLLDACQFEVLSIYIRPRIEAAADTYDPIALDWLRSRRVLPSFHLKYLFIRAISLQNTPAAEDLTNALIDVQFCLMSLIVDAYICKIDGRELVYSPHSDAVKRSRFDLSSEWRGLVSFLQNKFINRFRSSEYVPLKSTLTTATAEHPSVEYTRVRERFIGYLHSINWPRCESIYYPPLLVAHMHLPSLAATSGPVAAVATAVRDVGLHFGEISPEVLAACRADDGQVERVHELRSRLTQACLAVLEQRASWAHVFEPTLCDALATVISRKERLRALFPIPRRASDADEDEDADRVLDRRSVTSGSFAGASSRGALSPVLHPPHLTKESCLAALSDDESDDDESARHVPVALTSAVTAVGQSEGGRLVEDLTEQLADMALAAPPSTSSQAADKTDKHQADDATDTLATADDDTAGAGESCLREVASEGSLTSSSAAASPPVGSQRNKKKKSK